MSEILAYCDLLGIENVDQRVRLMRHIMRMDSAYLGEKIAKAEGSTDG